MSHFGAQPPVSRYENILDWYIYHSTRPWAFYMWSLHVVLLVGSPLGVLGLPTTVQRQAH